MVALSLLWILAGLIYSAQGASIESTEAGCCAEGRRRGLVTPLPPGPQCRWDHPPQPGPGCRFALRSCCLAVLRVRSCQAGAERALTGAECGGLKPFSHQEVAMECCLCCKLALWGRPLNDLYSGDALCKLVQPTCTNHSLMATTPATTPSDNQYETGTPHPTINLSTSLTDILPSVTPGTDIDNTNTTDFLNDTTVHPLPSTSSIDSSAPSSSSSTIQLTSTPLTTSALPLSTQSTDTTDNNVTVLQDNSEMDRINSTTSPDTTTRSNGGNKPPSNDEGIPTNTSVLCMEGFVWNAKRYLCERMITSCPQGFVMDEKKGMCVRGIHPIQPCERGYTLNRMSLECVDINECKENSTLCGGTGQMCVNKEGGFTCKCQVGFLVSREGNCIDIDECLTYKKSPCSQGQKCKNTLGSFLCVRDVPCGFGYVLNPETQRCNDVNECEIDENICGMGMVCVNVRGGHQCKDKLCPKGMKRNYRGICSYCGNGYQYNNITQKCVDIDECDPEYGEKVCKSHETCVNQAGSHSCKPKVICRRGTTLTQNGTDCMDIDECVERSFLCEKDEICINTFASYYCVTSPCWETQFYDYDAKQCVCRNGYRLNEDNKCKDINECVEKGSERLCGTQYQCVNHPGGYNCFIKAKCPGGMFRPNAHSRCQDIDECETGEAECGEHQKCENSVGSYTCSCERGFRMLGKECLDINECSLFRPDETCPDVNSHCLNTPGGYSCVCPQGFKWVGYPKKKCEDVNECREQPDICGVEHKCENMLGSYLCRCAHGYKNAEDNDKRCVDVNECKEIKNRRLCPNGLCINFPGGYRCQCPQGYKTGRNNMCVDIDECHENTGICSLNQPGVVSQDCINLSGSHKCVVSVCPTGYHKRNTGNGFLCVLDNNHHCSLKDIECLKARPYRIVYKFLELDEQTRLPLILTRVDVSHLPKAMFKMSMIPKYAINTETNQQVPMIRTFKIKPSRHEKGSIEISLLKRMYAPLEIFIELKTEAVLSYNYLGHSMARIFIYVTKYPSSFLENK